MFAGQKAATAGVAELETAVDGISSLINANGTDVQSAAQPCQSIASSGRRCR
jgi:hypothetical protein